MEEPEHRMEEPERTPEEINQHFLAMGHSNNFINEIVADDTEAKRVHDGLQGAKNAVSRNVEHLEVQLAKQWCQDDSRSKTSYEAAITAGKAYIAG